MNRTMIMVAMKGPRRTFKRNLHFLYTRLNWHVKNSLTETFLMSTHNIMFWLKNKNTRLCMNSYLGASLV